MLALIYSTINTLTAHSDYLNTFIELEFVTLVYIVVS